MGCPSAWPLTPGLIFGVGAVCGVIATALVANLWWLSYRRTRQAVVGFTAGALSTALREMAKAGVPDPGELRRCVDLGLAWSGLSMGRRTPVRKTAGADATQPASRSRQSAGIWSPTVAHWPGCSCKRPAVDTAGSMTRCVGGPPDGRTEASAMLGPVVEYRYGQAVDQPLDASGVRMRLGVTEFRDVPGISAVDTLQQWLRTSPEAREVCAVVARPDALVVFHRDSEPGV